MKKTTKLGIITFLLVGMLLTACSNQEKAATTTAAPKASTQQTAKPVSTTANKASVNTTTTKKAEVTGTQVTAVGDSVMLDIKPYIEEAMPGIHVDGKVGRQMLAGEEIINNLRDQGKLGSTVVIALGTNGVLSQSKFESFLGTLKDVPHIVLVNTRVPRKWEKIVNSTLQDAATQFPNVTLVNWYDASAHHDEYFANDGVHLTATGSKAYTKMLVAALKQLNA